MLFTHTRYLLMVLGLAVLAAIPISTFAAEEKPDDETGVIYNHTTQIRPDLGPPARSATAVVGRNGYKVFNPGAIATVRVIAVDAANARMGPLYRSGRTDAWLNWSWTHPYMSWDHISAHQSNSDLYEDKIYVRGYLKVTTDSTWRSACALEVSGHQAFCTNQFSDGLPRTIKAESHHGFEKSGYINQYFISNDTA